MSHSTDNPLGFWARLSFSYKPMPFKECKWKLPIMALVACLMVVFSMVACSGICNGQPPAQQNQLQNQPQGSGTVSNAGTKPGTIVKPKPGNQDKKNPELSEFDEVAAFNHLVQVCRFGSRVSRSPGMASQQEYIKAHFEKLGAEVHMQPFNARDPNTGQWVELKNMVVRWHPKKKNRLLICCHYDTRPFPDRDPVNPRGVFIGANDGASGVGLLCELGRHIGDMNGKYGIDFVFFDGEEYVFIAQRDPMFLGSTYFAQEYAKRNFKWRYQFGILVDMVADKNLEIHYEGNSLGFAPRLTRSIWSVAQELGVKEFVPQQRHKIRDDHLPLNTIGRIETCDIIDFDYPTIGAQNAYWHTTKDIVENCSAESLGKVGRVVLEWLRQMQRLNRGK